MSDSITLRGGGVTAIKLLYSKSEGSAETPA